jgi:hypothetical protein
MGTQKFDKLRQDIDRNPARRARVEEQKREALREIVEHSLTELRKTREVTQVELAEVLGMNQPGVSRIEHQHDVLLSTLRDYIEALGGRLEVAARFDDERIPLRSAGDSTPGAPNRGTGIPEFIPESSWKLVSVGVHW